jgi:hypothetical protein
MDDRSLSSDFGDNALQGKAFNEEAPDPPVDVNDIPQQDVVLNLDHDLQNVVSFQQVYTKVQNIEWNYSKSFIQLESPTVCFD